MISIRQFFAIEPVATPGASAAAYVPWVMVSRGLAFLRTLLVAAILGQAGQMAFGLYQPALELINPLVALVMFGAADVAERYAAHVALNEGHAGLRKWLLRQWLRIAAVGMGLFALLLLTSPWLSAAVWGQRQIWLLTICGATVLLLALYQHVAAVLRGLRAYAAAAGMELLGAILLLILSALAALFHSAPALVVAYAVSILVPLVLYLLLLLHHLHRPTESVPTPALPAKSPAPTTRFAAWSVIRLLLVMLFGFLALWGVRVLGDGMPTPSAPGGTFETAQFAMPFRIAQLLGFVAVTIWASSYGIAARAWSHGQVRRANVQIYRVGKWGMVVVSLIAVALLICRGVFEWLLPTYAPAIESLLPGMLALFMAYGLTTFFSLTADLREMPWRGAGLWGMAVTLQIAGIIIGRFGKFAADPKEFMVWLSTAALGAALILIAPLLLCRPMRFSATGIPLVILGGASVTLFSPEWVVNWIAGPALLGAIAFLYMTGLLIRPVDRRAYRRWKISLAQQPL